MQPKKKMLGDLAKVNPAVPQMSRAPHTDQESKICGCHRVVVCACVEFLGFVPALKMDLRTCQAIVLPSIGITCILHFPQSPRSRIAARQTKQ
jgi:hypothetical protein